MSRAIEERKRNPVKMDISGIAIAIATNVAAIKIVPTITKANSLSPKLLSPFMIKNTIH